MPSRLTLLLITIVILAIVLPNSPTGGGVFAFGAGENIPGFAYLEGRAFRHGDIEDVLEELLKKTMGAGLLGRGGAKFGGLDIKRVYFGNWLRDYSQAMDVMPLQYVQKQSILNLITVFGFLANGYATGAFEVTEERLGVYLPVEHIDNPKGYGAEGDPRRSHPKLRPPVQPIEWAVDPQTGMKNYIANEYGQWDTSKAHIRRLLDACIQLGRQFRSSAVSEQKYEAYRLLGSALHTLEDFAAHSNFCELALIQLGHREVFPQVGSNTMIRAPNGQSVWPLVTGTFGGSDFIHSLLGEASDHVSSASVSELNEQVEAAKRKKTSKAKGTNAQCGSIDAIKELLSKIPGMAFLSSNSDLAKEMDAAQNQSRASGKNPNEMNPTEIRNAIWPILTFRDDLVMRIEKIIEAIPGLQDLLDTLMESISVYVFTALEPFLKPLLQSAQTQLFDSSAAVVNNHDQYEVFNNPNSSDPTHSFLSKDHFGLILNEPAGNLAKIIVKYSVPLIIQAWDDTSINPRNVSEDILQCLFHPAYHNPASRIQADMLGYMRLWIESQGSARSEVIRRLTRESIKTHQNQRFNGLVSVGDGNFGSHGALSAGGGGGGGGGVGGSSVLGGLVNQAALNQASNFLGKVGISTPNLGDGKDGKGGKDGKDGKKKDLDLGDGKKHSKKHKGPSHLVTSYSSVPPTPYGAGGYAEASYGGTPAGGYAAPRAFPDASAPGMPMPSIPNISTSGNVPSGGYTFSDDNDDDYDDDDRDGKKDKKDKKHKKDKKDKKDKDKDKDKKKDKKDKDKDRSFGREESDGTSFPIPPGPAGAYYEAPAMPSLPNVTSSHTTHSSHSSHTLQYSGSSYNSMPSAPGSVPAGFPSPPSFGGAPSFPSAPGMPSAFPGAFSSSGYAPPSGPPPSGYAPPSGPPPGGYAPPSGAPPRGGPPHGFPTPNAGGYPGAGGHHHEWTGSSSGW